MWPAFREFGLPPEHELLLHCARRTLEPARRERVAELLSGPWDGAVLFALAERNALLGFLHHHLQGQKGAERLPGLREACHQQALRTVALKGELLELVELFERAGVKMFPFKGPLLAARLYGEEHLRTFGDLDILVRPADALRAQALLEEFAYRPQFAIPPALLPRFVRLYGERTYHHRQSGHTADLHWAATIEQSRLWPSAEELMQEPESVPLGGRTVQTFNTGNLFLFLCLHGALHGWERLSWLCDLAELLRSQVPAQAGSKSPPLDFARVLERSRELGCRRILHWGLALASRLLEAPVPPEVSAEWHADGVLPSLLDGSRALMFGPGGRRWAVPGLWTTAMDRRADAWRFWVNAVLKPTANEWRLMGLPPSLFWVYAVIRPFRLVGKRLARLCGKRPR